MNGWREQLTPGADYTFKLTYRDQGGVPAKWRPYVADVCDLIAWWNKRMTRPGKGGRNKIRSLHLEMFRAVAQCLQVFTADKLAEAIDHYSRNDWSRKTGHWKRPTNFFKVGYLVETIVAEIDDARTRAESAEIAAAAQADPRMRQLAADVASASREPDEWAELQAAFNALEPAVKQSLRKQAAAELLSLGQSPRMRAIAVEKQALIVLKRQREPQHQEKHT